MNLLAAIAKDRPRRITHPKQIAELLDLCKQGLVSFRQQVYDGKVVAIYDIQLLKAREVPLATKEDFYSCRTQELLQ